MIAYNIHNAAPYQRQKSPLEDGVWLMPADATEIVPPDFDPKTHTCRFDGSEWVVAKIPEVVSPKLTPETDLEPVESEGESVDVVQPDPSYVETYADKRIAEYGGVGEQIEFITENGLDAWKTKVEEIKAKYPKT